MSWQPKLRPKGFPHSIDDYAVASLSELEHRSRTGEEKRDQRVFRVKRKHVLKACDRCRVKKTKCDGKQPCNRCSVYNHPCLFRERKATQTKVYSRGFVEMLESHHSLVVKALQKLYTFCIANEGFPGEPLEEAPDGHPLTHAILDRLGLIKQAEENADEPDEDSEDLRYLRMLSTSTECSATAEPSPEPTTPPGPSPTSISRPCLCTNPTPTPPMTRTAPSWSWDMPHIPQSGGYPSYADQGYQNLMGLPTRSSDLTSLDLSPSEISPHHVDIATSSSLPHGRHEPGFAYYLDVCNNTQPDAKPARMHTGIMRPLPHQIGVSGDMMNDFSFHAHDSPYFPGFTPGWSFPST